jgi:ribosomal 50S subunit-associated protein YjgA (DUF615 family)
LNPQETVLTVAALLTALTAIGYFLRKVYKIAHRIDQTLGVDKQGRTIADRLERVEHQLFPNGGSSLTDKINRIEKEQNVLFAQIETLRAMLLNMVGGKIDDRPDGDAAFRG